MKEHEYKNLDGYLESFFILSVLNPQLFLVASLVVFYSELAVDTFNEISQAVTLLK